MGFLSKLKFWHKEDDLDFDTLADKEMGKIPSSDIGLEQNHGLDEKSPFGEEQEQFTGPRFQTSRAQNAPAFTPQSQGPNRDLELINSKLDTLKAMLGSMDQRMAHLEQQNSGNEKKQKLW